MAGQITGLRFQQETADRVSVYLDGQFAFGLPALEAARLRIGQYLDDAEIAQLRLADETQKVYDRAVRFLGHRPRSTAEVRRYLARVGADPALSAVVLEKLTAQGYLNDAEFARYWVENRERFRPKGERALRQELRQRGVAEDIIATALVGANAVASAYAAAQPRAARLAALASAEPDAFRRKLGDFLARRGFDYETIHEVVEQLTTQYGADRSFDAD